MTAFVAFQKNFPASDEPLELLPEFQNTPAAYAHQAMLGKLACMHEGAAGAAPNRLWIWSYVRASAPKLPEASLAAGSALLTVLSFPNFDLWFLAWLSLTPLLVAVAGSRNTGRAFVAGLLWGTIFFYGSCWWLTYPMIHFGHIPAWLAYPLFLPPVIWIAIFPALFCALLRAVIGRLGLAAIFVAPFIWLSVELARYALTGQLWNALGYSQPFHPAVIQPAPSGHAHPISFLLVAASAAA